MHQKKTRVIIPRRQVEAIRTPRESEAPAPFGKSQIIKKAPVKTSKTRGTISPIFPLYFLYLSFFIKKF